MLKLFNFKNIIAKIFATMVALVYTIFFAYICFFTKGDRIIFLAYITIPTSMVLYVLISILGITSLAIQITIIYIAGILQYGFLGYCAGLILNELILFLTNNRK
jgi:hypothetical protein